MPTAIREAEAAEIEAFLAENKTLEAVPIWRGSSWPGELTAVWNVGIASELDGLRCAFGVLDPMFAL